MGFPLIYADINKPYVIDRITKEDASTKRLIEMGFSRGVQVVVKSKNNGSVIVEVFGSKVALDKNIASKIYIRELKKEDSLTM